jgi:hypothetical protein
LISITKQEPEAFRVVREFRCPNHRFSVTSP